MKERNFFLLHGMKKAFKINANIEEKWDLSTPKVLSLLLYCTHCRLNIKIISHNIIIYCTFKHLQFQYSKL